MSMDRSMLHGAAASCVHLTACARRRCVIIRWSIDFEYYDAPHRTVLNFWPEMRRSKQSSEVISPGNNDKPPIASALKRSLHSHTNYLPERLRNADFGLRISKTKVPSIRNPKSAFRNRAHST